MRFLRLRGLKQTLLVLLTLTIVGPAAHAGNWADHVLKVGTYSRQIQALEAEVKELIAQRRHTRDPEQLKSIIDTIAAKHKELEEVADKHEKEWAHMRFRHPEQAEIVKGQYVRYKIKSIQAMESELGMDGKLDRIKQQVMVVFPIPEESSQERSKLKISTLIRKPAADERASADDPYVFEKVRLVK